MRIARPVQLAPKHVLYCSLVAISLRQHLHVQLHTRLLTLTVQDNAPLTTAPRREGGVGGSSYPQRGGKGGFLTPTATSLPHPYAPLCVPL